MQVVCFGDSNTYGFDPRSWFGSRYEPNCRWVDILSQETGWHIRNLGQNGQQIPSHIRDIPTCDLLILMLGTNDLLQGLNAQEVCMRMKKFLTQFDRSQRILLVAPPPMQPGEWVSDPALIRDSQYLGTLYQKLAQKLQLGFADAASWNICLCFDGVHFTESGHQTFAAVLLHHIKTNEEWLYADHYLSR